MSKAPEGREKAGRAWTPGPWFVSGVRFRMNGGHWHSVNRYDESKKRDENVACVGYDPRTGIGFADARLIASAPDLFEALRNLADVSRSYLEHMDADDLEAIDRARLALSHATATGEVK